MKLNAKLTGVAVAALALLVHSAVQAQMPEQAHLRTVILQTLLNDPELGQYPLAASVGADHSVVLSGVLPNKEDKDEAARLVKSIAGVKGVNNEISVDAKATPLSAPNGATAPAAAATPAATPNGQPTPGDIQTSIQNALSADPALAGVTATVGNEQVTITGSVATKQDRSRAEKIARKNAQKLKVVDQIHVIGST